MKDRYGQCESCTEGGAAANGAPIDAVRLPQPVSDLPVELPVLDLAQVRREARCSKGSGEWHAADVEVNRREGHQGAAVQLPIEHLGV
jgi:hypothetical protein